ncbi:MAG: AGE family epimerase/isomerase [Ginsengibacter sp.]
MQKFKSELQDELASILNYWQQHTIDAEFGGFYGKLNNKSEVHKNAPKGSVLNSRILWAFSAGYNLTANTKYFEAAQRAFEYFIENFIDKKYGGVYWTLDFTGNPADTKKQIYAQSFAIYGLSEFYLASQNELAKEKAIELFHLVIEHSYDRKFGGYIEALSGDWEEIKDLRLSDKDANEKKSMNTHLHVLEGFTNLYRIWPHENLKDKIRELLNIFLDHIIDKNTNHLMLFFDENWEVKSNLISYGHDIEAAWLLLESAIAIEEQDILERIKIKSIQIADAAAEGLDTDGGLWYEYDADKDHLIKEKHSWPQAESMVGFFNAWEISGDENYLLKSFSSWKFIKDYIADKTCGEWFWGVKENYELMEEDKVGIWKCPYHNSRSCIELIRRISNKLV